MSSSSKDVLCEMQLDDTTDDIHTIEWRIINFSCCTANTGQRLECLVDTAGNLYHTRWQLVIYPKGGKLDKCSNDLGLFIKRDANEKVGPESIHVEFELYLVAFDGVKAIKKVASEEFKRGNSYGFYNFIKLEDLFCRKGHLLQSDRLIVGCQLRRLPPKHKLTSQHYFVTKYDSEKLSRKMPLCSFKRFTKQDPEELTLRDSKNLLKMKVSLNKDEISEKENAGASEKPETSQDSKTDSSKESFLHMVMVKKEAKNPVSVSCCVKLFNQNLKIVLEKEMSHSFSDLEEEEWVLPYFIDTDKLEDGCIGIGDTLNLEFDLIICSSKPHSFQKTDQTPLKPIENPKETTLMKDLDDLLKEAEFSDVTLRIGDATFPAHKCILAKRSPRFRKIFKDSMRVEGENQTKEVEILDVDENTMELMLQFIYNDKLGDIDDVQCLPLYSAAVKYEISSLQLKCVGVLKKNLSVNQVYKVLLIAEELADSEIKMIALDFLFEHYQAVMLTPEWQEFVVSHEELADQALRHLRLKKQQQGGD